MISRASILTTGLIVVAGIVYMACDAAPLQPAGGGVEDIAAGAGFEVWIADQSDTRPGHGGQLLIYEGTRLMAEAAQKVEPIARIDLGDATTRLCLEKTGRNPTRPHMVLFNREGTHAILSFVASGHVVIIDADARRPLDCFETTIGSTGTRQAHAAFPSPDGTYILIANQNGRRLERITTDYAANRFVHDPVATLDLAACTTPAGRPCEDPLERPINWPICPIIDASSRYAFVTLRGGGMFVVDAKAPKISIVAEYTREVVSGNGCGGVQAGNRMYINSGGSPVDVADDHPDAHGFEVYRFAAADYGASNQPNTPAPERLFSKDGFADSHGMTAVGRDRFVWVMDRHGDVAEIIDVGTGRRVNTVPLNGPLTDNAAPDLADAAPAGNRIFVSLRGPKPLSGDPHNATGSTPGLGVIRVTDGGRSGQLIAIVPITNPWQQPGQTPDPHGMRVRPGR